MQTRAKLRAAVLDLASRAPVEEITVSDLTKKAGINRSTFYKHASSPADLLRRVIWDELDGLRAEIFALAAPGTALSEALEHGLHGLAEHVVRFSALYTTGLVDHSSGALHALLNEHSIASFTALLEGRADRMPPGASGDAVSVAMYSAFLAHGVTGVMESWLRTTGTGDPGLFVATVLAVLPPWLTGAEGTSHRSQERSTS
ncbi:TetR family transcriptional regulator [Actinocorallia herbida]|uniref:TetR family transcriptional regulator n=1 Tax=Actinocorallia herbida TaxID=58109 RepID=A0A3N1CYI2_9ACTN|nr:TetR family transcriptional regulator [Actinocorallia herbida]